MEYGRPRIYAGEAALSTVTVRLTVWHMRAARRLGGGNASEGVRRAIEQADCGMDTVRKPEKQRDE